MLGRRASSRYHPACLVETKPLNLTVTGKTRRRLHNSFHRQNLDYPKRDNPDRRVQSRCNQNTECTVGTYQALTLFSWLADS
jgi:hypothetical protein